MKREKEERGMYPEPTEWDCVLCIVGFWFFETSLPDGTYGRERRASIPRQGVADKDRFWDAGLRVTIGGKSSIRRRITIVGNDFGRIAVGRFAIVSGLRAFYRGCVRRPYARCEETGRERGAPNTLGCFLTLCDATRKLLCLIYGDRRPEERMGEP